MPLKFHLLGFLKRLGAQRPRANLKTEGAFRTAKTADSIQSASNVRILLNALSIASERFSFRLHPSGSVYSLQLKCEVALMPHTIGLIKDFALRLEIQSPSRRRMRSSRHLQC